MGADMEEKKYCKWYNEEMCTNDKSPCVADYCPVVEYPELCKIREIEDGMTDEEIIKALKCCSTDYNKCEECPYYNKGKTCRGTNYRLEKDVLDLIHRLQSEIERLTEERDGNKFNSGKYNRALESLSKERRLNAELQKQVDDKKAEEGEIYEWAKKNMLFGKGN